jgi:hypothetical protein
MSPAKALETTFRKAWIVLYTQGVSPEYLRALRQFTQTASETYGLGFTLPALNLELLAMQTSTGDAALDAILTLDDQEIRIRRHWLHLIYLTLDRVTGQALVEEPDLQELAQLVEGVYVAYEQGHTLDTLKLELRLDTPTRSPEESSILSQWMRLIFLTLEQAAPR